MKTLSVPKIIIFGGLIRLVLILWGEYQDSHFEVKYTDIDYEVFTDAARFVSKGLSPYERSTYRYSPLLAYVLLPNIWFFKAWGKFLFSACDLVAATILNVILRNQRVSLRHRRIAAVALLFNPFTFTISTRGSCDSIVILVLLTVLCCLLYGHVRAAALLYGLAVHLRIYPIIYCFSLVLFLWKQKRLVMCRMNSYSMQQRTKLEESDKNSPIISKEETVLSNSFLNFPPLSSSSPFPSSSPSPSFPSSSSSSPPPSSSSPLPSRLRTTLYSAFTSLASLVEVTLSFGFTSGGFFLLLGSCFYLLYGTPFLHESYLYHLSRRDPRHNFSPYFYPVYLSYEPESVRRTTSWKSSGIGDSSPYDSTATRGSWWEVDFLNRPREIVVGREIGGERGIFSSQQSHPSTVTSPSSVSSLSSPSFVSSTPPSLRAAPKIVGPKPSGTLLSGICSSLTTSSPSLITSSSSLSSGYVIQSERIPPKTLPLTPPLTLSRSSLTSFLSFRVPFFSSSSSSSSKVSLPSSLSHPLLSSHFASLPPPLLAATGALWGVPLTFMLVLVTSLRLVKELPTAWLIATWIFVAFNKVCTAQYFVWFFALLPLSLHLLPFSTPRSLCQLASVLIFWILSQLHWLFWAYLLEFKGHSVHLVLWSASLIFMASNVAAICVFLRTIIRTIRISAYDAQPPPPSSSLASEAARPCSFLEAAVEREAV